MKNSKALEKELLRTLKESKTASRVLAQLTPAFKKKVLLDAASLLKKNEKFILTQNALDLRNARQSGLSPAMIDRLTLNPRRIAEMAQGIKEVASLSDPIGKVLEKWKRPNGLVISKVSVPLGVILIIFESRPNVTVECASLCFKSGNAVLLRGGKEAFHSNQALASVFEKVFRKHGLPSGCASALKTTDREAVDFLLTRDKEINLVIPRGGKSLIEKVVASSRIPVVKHYEGVCHVYVDQKADFKKAEAIILNGKLQRPGVCNAVETLLVHQKVASKFLPAIGRKLHDGGCELRADHAAKKWLENSKLAQASDFGREFLDKILAVKVVSGLDAAVEHIQEYGSGHTDAIVTQDPKTAKVFTQKVDSSSVMVNASTRFADGFQYGFGAEIGISTDKIHARGPMGLEGLTSYKYVVQGNGQIRE